MNESKEAVEELEQGRSLHLPIKIGHNDERQIEVLHGVDLLTVIRIIAVERGCIVEELIIVREGEELPLDPGTVIGPDYPHHRRHHVHHRSEVKVNVNYNAGTRHREFRRHETIEDVLTWAIKIFNIDPAMAPEFELALHGSKDELPGIEHIGHLAGHHKELDLDLIRGALVNGAV